MKAIVQLTYGSADVLQLMEIDMPVVKDNEVLLRVHAAGLDPGVWHLMTGLPYLVRIMGYGLFKPKNRIPGSDVAGYVEAVGKNATKFKPGDEVFGAANGSFAEYVCAKEHSLHLKPANLTFEQAAAVYASGVTALQALRDEGQMRSGQEVLIIGAGGGVGTFAVQIAKALGARVTGVCSTTKVDLVRSIGADEVIDYRQEDFSQRAEKYNLILDTAGNRPLSSLRRALLPRGTLVIVGGEEGGRWLGGMGRVIKALMLSPFVGQRLRMQMPKTQPHDLDTLKVLFESGEVSPMIDKTFPLDDVSEAIRYIEKGHASGKVVITVS